MARSGFLWFTFAIILFLVSFGFAAPSCPERRPEATDCAREEHEEGTTSASSIDLDASEPPPSSHQAGRRHHAAIARSLGLKSSNRIGKSRLPSETNGGKSKLPLTDASSGIFRGIDSVKSHLDPGSSGSSTPHGDKAAYLAAHNTFRAQHGAAALSWSDKLATKAQKWANRCVFEHSKGDFGENLVYSSSPSFTIEQGIKLWTDEEKDYNPKSPQFSHFTQVVWKETQKLGCAMTHCDGSSDARLKNAKYIVCEYSPQGNIIGQFAANVEKIL